MLVSENAKELCYQRETPTQVSEIYIVRYQTQISRVGHVHFKFFVLISFAFGGQRKPSFQWNMGLKHTIKEIVMFISFNMLDENLVDYSK